MHISIIDVAFMLLSAEVTEEPRGRKKIEEKKKGPLFLIMTPDLTCRDNLETKQFLPLSPPLLNLTQTVNQRSYYASPLV